MTRKHPITDSEMSDFLKDVLDDLERMKAVMRGVIVTLDDMRCRVIVRHEDLEPGPWDDEHPENKKRPDGRRCDRAYRVGPERGRPRESPTLVGGCASAVPGLKWQFLYCKRAFPTGDSSISQLKETAWLLSCDKRAVRCVFARI